MRIKYIVPYPFGPEGVELRAQQVPASIGPDVTVDVVPVRNSCRIVDSYYEAAILEAYVTEIGVLAEEEGYDAVVMDSVADPALDALRSRLTIPVVGPGEAAFHLARMLGHRFSILTMWDTWSFNYRRVLLAGGLTDALASIRSADMRPDVEHLFADNRDAVLERLTEEGRKAIAEDGADVLVLGSTTMHQAADHLAAELGCPVVNPGPAAISLAAMYVRLGLRHSKLAWPSPGEIQDEKLFSLVGVDGNPRA